MKEILERTVSYLNDNADCHYGDVTKPFGNGYFKIEYIKSLPSKHDTYTLSYRKREELDFTPIANSTLFKDYTQEELEQNFIHMILLKLLTYYDKTRSS